MDQKNKRFQRNGKNRLEKDKNFKILYYFL